MNSLYYMERMTYPQIERLAARTDLAMLPVGPPEAHGPHLPIGMDYSAVRELCDRAARGCSRSLRKRLSKPSCRL